MSDIVEAYNRCGSCRHFVPQHTDRNGRTMGECRGRPTHPNVQAHEYGCPEYHVERTRVSVNSPIPEDADLSPRQREANRRIEQLRASQVSSRKTTERVKMVRLDDEDDEDEEQPVFESQEVPIQTTEGVAPPSRRELRALLADVVGEALDRSIGLSNTPMHPRYKGGKLLVVPANPELQSKELEVDVLFKKVVTIRDKLRVLEQKINASDKLPSDEKVQLQQYITGCYGTLTSFNYLFRDKDDHFVGESKG